MAGAVLTAILAVFAAAGPAAAAPSLMSVRQAPVAGGCTTSSFTIPSWLVTDFHANAVGTVFNLTNRATDGPKVWMTCGGIQQCSQVQKNVLPALNASVQLDYSHKTAKVTVTQSWNCTDRDTNKPIIFTASGVATIPLHEAGEPYEYKSANSVDLVRGSLEAPLQITPAYSPGPLGHDRPGCAANSLQPRWTLGTVIYINETGDGTDAIPSQSIQFHVTNEATGYVAGCLMYWSPGADDAPVLMTCGGGADFTRRNRYSERTETVFYPRTWSFSINQTWYCDDVDAAKPSTYTGVGNLTLPLTCTTEATTRYCQADSVSLSGTLASSAVLTPYSIEDPLPTPDGCTISSVVSPSWTISNFEVDHRGGGPLTALGEGSGDHPALVAFSIRFNTALNTFDYPIFVSHDGVNLDDAETWWPCTFGVNEQPLAPKRCSFQYDAGKNRLSVKADWVCVDIDAENPVLFSGIATTNKLPELDCVTASLGVTTCGTFGSWVAPIEDVTWRRADEPVNL